MPRPWAWARHLKPRGRDPEQRHSISEEDRVTRNDIYNCANRIMKDVSELNDPEELRREIVSSLDDLVALADDDGYERGFDEGEEAAEKNRDYPDIDADTERQLLTGLSLLKSGDPQASVYLDRVLSDFNANLITRDLDQPRLF